MKREEREGVQPRVNSSLSRREVREGGRKRRGRGRGSRERERGGAGRELV
jgi:hypothetical protein